MDKNDENPASKLMRSLLLEALQAEQSADRHPRVEASRNPGNPPGEAMSRVADHATRSLPELRALAERYVTPEKGQALGAALSQLRTHLIDQATTKERSYRATLIGMRHGLDTLVALQYAAAAAGATELVTLCKRVATERGPLIEAAAQAWVWFVENPGIGAELVDEGVLARGVHAVAEKLGLS